MIRLLFAGTIFSSAFLLFLVQPIISKNILPWFGGSAGVWATCMVFFQVVLLLGYAYSDWSSRHLQPRVQVALHIVLLTASLLCLPVLADPSWKPRGGEDPGMRILLLLASTVGLPYFLLSTTGPLVQAWVARTLIGAQVYRFFSLSNLASLIALISYPFLIEPNTPLLMQAHAWAGVYVVFAVLCCASALYFLRHMHERSGKENQLSPAAGQAPPRRLYLWWLSLSAMAAWMLLAVTNHITQNVAPIPFLWLLPLTIYLLTFVLCFESSRWYRRRYFLLPTAVLLGVCAYGLQNIRLSIDIKTAIPLYVAGLFLMCMFLHGELAAMKPHASYLTRFYLMVSLGGALGGIAVGLIAPRVLPAYFELGIGLVVIAMLAIVLFRHQRWLLLGSGALTALAGFFLYSQMASHFEGSRIVERNFYGALRTLDAMHGMPPVSVRQLYHGSIRHGEQYLHAERRMEPTTYYGRTSGVGLAIAQTRTRQKRVGLIGLGAGTLAAYGRPGDYYRFYEINPQMVEVARQEFTFLRGSAARVDVTLGDARLTLENEAPNSFDVLAIDAFSGDSIPVHLLTREAMAIYKAHINEQGIIAVHVSNRYLSLAPVVQQLAEDQGMFAARIHDAARSTTLHSSEWILVAKNQAVLQQPAIARAASAFPTIAGLRLWTDDFNNLFQIIK